MYVCIHIHINSYIMYKLQTDIRWRTVHNQVIFRFETFSFRSIRLALPVHVDQEAPPPQWSAAWPSDAGRKGGLWLVKMMKWTNHWWKILEIGWLKNWLVKMIRKTFGEKSWRSRWQIQPWSTTLKSGRRATALAAHHRRPVPQAAPAGSAEAWRQRCGIYQRLRCPWLLCNMTKGISLLLKGRYII